MSCAFQLSYTVFKKKVNKTKEQEQTTDNKERISAADY